LPPKDIDTGKKANRGGRPGMRSGLLVKNYQVADHSWQAILQRGERFLRVYLLIK